MSDEFKCEKYKKEFLNKPVIEACIGEIKLFTAKKRLYYRSGTIEHQNSERKSSDSACSLKESKMLMGSLRE